MTRFAATGISYDESRDTWRFGLTGSNFDFPVDSSMEDGQWHHVAVIRKGSDARFYLDGPVVGGSIAVPDNSLDIDPGGLVFGQDQDVLGGGFEADQSWAGAMDNLRIYNRALSSSEVQTIAGEARQ